jgi:hypothetical protein
VAWGASVSSASVSDRKSLSVSSELSKKRKSLSTVDSQLLVYKMHMEKKMAEKKLFFEVVVVPNTLEEEASALKVEAVYGL